MIPLLQFTDRGIYCSQADVFIDPWKPVKKALITHGHADHAYSGHQQYLCHALTAGIIRMRISPNLNIQETTYGAPIMINGVRFSFHPAGHVIGSSQIRVEFKGEVWVASGDYKAEDDGISAPIEIVPCHTFITECTFGLPVYDWKPQTEIFDGINEWWKTNAELNKPSIIYAYSLGKAQRLLHNVDGNIGRIYTHGAIENMNNLFRDSGINLKPSHKIEGLNVPEDIHKSLIIAPPATLNSSWTKKFKHAVHASASGWMTLRGARRRRGVDRGFIVSDHADWKGLNEVIKGTGAENIIATHGYQTTFVRWLNDQGYHAITQETSYQGESLDESKEEEVA